MFKPIQPASIEWQGDTPFSPQFGDIYFSREGSLAETQHIFLQGNNLPNRWKNRPRFTILETGFGTASNFLSTAQTWQETSQKGQWLYYISIEKHPIQNLEPLHAHLPESLKPLAKKLRQALPPAIPGFHWHVFEEERITLLLIQADIATALPELEAKIDAWFLDGFAPAKNPEMWGDALYQGMKNLSAEGATFATYTAASSVRAGVESAGFQWKKQSGFAHKKHMLCGQRPGTYHAEKKHKRALIIGGGLAGCFAANALARQGVHVTLIERHKKLAQEASGNNAAVMKPYLAKMWAEQTLLYNQAFYYARNQAIKNNLFHLTGALQLEKESRHQALGLPKNMAEMVGISEASSIAGVAVKQPGVYLPDGGWIEPQLYCEAAISSPNITTVFETEALTLSRSGDVWKVNNKYEAPIVVIANAMDALSFRQLSHLPLIAMRGQITFFPKTQPLKTIVSYGGYALSHGDVLTLGATYGKNDMEPEVRDIDNEKNISLYNEAFVDPILAKPIGARVAWRVVTPSKRPLVGRVEEGLYVSLGLGSRGTMLGPYLAEQIAAEICGTPQPLQKSVKMVLSKY